jgi:acetylornithine deacetylase/succinyl-diaminopimelate desuccinylase-like protein
VQVSEKMYADYALEVTDAGGHSSLPRTVNPIYTLSAALQRLAAWQFPVRLDDDARLFLSRSAATESGRLAADLRAAAGTPADSAALRRVLTHVEYAARLRTTCVATRIEGGHANNALPQLARAVVNCRLLPGTSPAETEATLRRLAGDSVRLTVLNPPEPSPPSPAGTSVYRTLDSLAGAFWSGVPVLPEMSTGGTDGAATRRAGIPTYGAYGLADDMDDVRAHGRDERIGVDAFYDAVEFTYRVLRALAGGAGGI